jgi:hypothetical protein
MPRGPSGWLASLALLALVGCGDGDGGGNGFNVVDDDDAGAGDCGEGVPQFWYDDADGDGFGDPETGTEGCDGLPGQLALAGDCDDSDPDIHPNSTQRTDGVDSDCDGRRDWLAQVWISGDDDFEWCLDDEEDMVPADVHWNQGQYYEVWTHVFGIRGWDEHYVTTAVIAHIQLSDGSIWVTDADWTFDPEPQDDPESRAGWCTPGFDDSPWQAVNVIGPIGTYPWNYGPTVFPPGSPAQWIWDYYPVELNTQYVRRQVELP